MKKSFLFMVLFAVILCGCSRKNTSAQPRMVTKVDIFCRHKDTEFSRHYTENEKMEAVLLYMRLLKPDRTPSQDFLSTGDDFYEIRVHLSDGHTRLYKQKDHLYFWHEQTGWKTIPPEQASQLYGLMRHYQSDL